MFESFLFIIAGLIIAYASYTDWKTTEVPDELTYAGIGFGLIARALYAFVQSDAQIFLAGVYGFALLFIVGCALYYTGQWGGGDAKLLMALGALLGISFSFSHPLIALLVNLLLVGGLYGLVYTFVLAVLHKDKVVKAWKEQCKVLSTFRLLSYVSCLVLIIAAFFVSGIFKWTLVVLGLMFPMSFYLLVFSKAVEDVALVKKVKPRELMEGDWILDTVKDGKKIVASPKDLGITVAQIKKLKAMKKLKYVTIKQGIPFVPAFLFAYIATALVGNMFLLLL